MVIKHRVVLDVSSPDVQCVLKMTKGDTSSHEIYFSFRSKGENITFSDRESAYLHVKKPDGTIVIISGVVYGPKSVYPDQAVFILTQQTLAAVGRVLLRAVIVSAEGEELYSPVCAVDVVQNPALDIDITSQSEYVALTNAKLDAEAWARGTKGGLSVPAGADQYENNARYYAEKSKADGEAWARGTRNGVSVGSGDEEYQNNAMYYAEQAALEKNAAESEKNSAGDYAEEAEAWAKGTRNGSDVAPTDDQYRNNAKYYSGLSEHFADEADGAAGRVNTAAQEAISAIYAATGTMTQNLNTDFLTKLIITVLGDTVTLKTNKKNPATNAAGDESAILPLATSSSAGAMSPSDVVAISTLISKVAALEGRAVRLMYTAGTSPTASEIAAFVASEGYTQNLEYIAVVVKQTFHVWHYYTTDGTWRDDGVDTVSQFTNIIAGLIKGSATDGKIYAENDGTGSVYGWDALKGRVSDIETILAASSSLFLPQVTNADNGKILKVVSGEWVAEALAAYAGESEVISS